ncbi:TPA: hypothetical protein ACKQE6_002645 [Serratia marcescens]
MKPLASTVRTVEWDELPARARDIPFAFNPFEDGVLMAHQAECLSYDVSILAIPKGRRTGITFAWGLNSTLIAGAQKAAGGDNVYYIGDTKEKGLEFIGYVAKFARVIAAQQAQEVSAIEEFLFEDQDDKGNTRMITAYRVRFASGFQVAALSSRPANIRGLQGVVVIDEAAFHQDVQGVLDAATALLIWGGESSSSVHITAKITRSISSVPTLRPGAMAMMRRCLPSRSMMPWPTASTSVSVR